MAHFLMLMHSDIDQPVEASNPESWLQYIARLDHGGNFVGGGPLAGGACVNKDGERHDITDHISGYMVIEAADIEMAKRLVEGNPAYEAGGTVEFREIAEI